MPIDLNKFPKQQERDEDGNIIWDTTRGFSKGDSDDEFHALSSFLSAYAERIFPEMFPMGVIRYGKNKELRLANIHGGPPRNNGSCCIELTGDHAGFYTEFDNGCTKGPMGLLADAFPGENSFKVAHELVDKYGGQSYLANVKKNHDRIKVVTGGSNRERDNAKGIAEAKNNIDQSIPLPGTLGETYLRNRNVNFTPDNIRFYSNCTNFDDRRGYPALISIYQTVEGEPTGGIHRTYLKDDGSGHLGKKMLGPAGFIKLWGAVEVHQGFRVLGVCGGIESTLAGILMYRCGGWAAGSDKHLVKIGDWIRENGAERARALICDHLLIWADRKTSGGNAGGMVYAACQEVGFPATLIFPLGGDDLADDLAKGLLPGPGMATPWIAGGGVTTHLTIQTNSTVTLEGQDTPAEAVPTFAQVDVLIRALDANAPDRDAQGRALEMIARGSAVFTDLERDQLIKALSGKMRSQKRLVERAVADTETRLGINRRGNAVAGGADWQALVHRFENGESKPQMQNVVIAFNHDPLWRNVLWFSDFSNMIMLRQRPPYEPDDGKIWEERKWGDFDDVAALEWCQNAGLNVTKTHILEAAYRCACQRRYHPIQEHFIEIGYWDGIPRLDTWLIRYCGAKNEEIVRVIGSRWLIGCVARVHDPGCKFDYALILEGAQGIGKSTIFSILGGKWYTDDIDDLGTKDSAMQIYGMWIVEIPELSSMFRSEVNRVKAFLSRQKDHFRPPYGKYVMDFERQSAFAGTVNGNDYLKDETGGRRFWPVECGMLDLAALRRDRNQLIAEAVHRYRNGETKCWIDEKTSLEQITNEQKNRFAEDIWCGPIQEYIQTKTTSLGFSTAEILYHGLYMTDRDKWGRAQQMRVASVLRSLGYTLRIRLSDPSKIRQWIFCKPDIDIPYGYTRS